LRLARAVVVAADAAVVQQWHEVQVTAKSMAMLL
jgi:hypothetical protein